MAKKQSKPRTKKFRTIAISIFFAIVVWFAVIYVNDPDITTTISDLNIRIVGEASLRDKQLAVTGRGDIPELAVVVTGKRSDLISFMDDIYVQVDVNGINAVGEYNLTGTISLPTTRITVEKENYGNIPIRIEKLESKDIEISVKQTGTLKNKLVKSQPTNPTVTITGAASEIERVHGAVATVDISNLTSDSIDRVGYLMTNEAGELINMNETLETTHSFIEVENTIYDAKTLPIEPALTSELERGYILKTDKTVCTPTTVTVGVDSENTDDRVIARIDRLDVSDGMYSLEATNGMYIPPEVQWVKVRPDIVKKSVEELELNVEAWNTPEGHSAQVMGTLRARVWGEDGSINQNNVHAYVDLSGLSAGEYTMPVRISDDNFGFMHEYTIAVKIE